MLLELINLLHMIKLEFLHQTSQSKVKGKTQWAIRKTQGFNLVLEKKKLLWLFLDPGLISP